MSFKDYYAGSKMDAITARYVERMDELEYYMNANGTTDESFKIVPQGANSQGQALVAIFHKAADGHEHSFDAKVEVAPVQYDPNLGRYHKVDEAFNLLLRFRDFAKGGIALSHQGELTDPHGAHLKRITQFSQLGQMLRLAAEDARPQHTYHFEMTRNGIAFPAKTYDARYHDVPATARARDAQAGRVHAAYAANMG